mmetsp:Transcript_36806/g.101246  ORF Transcript_36806/g.101246 Transcript_36806/m.101246 type:complete len:300 (-) Transcript_36806:1077-1976(-)
MDDDLLRDLVVGVKLDELVRATAPFSVHMFSKMLAPNLILLDRRIDNKDFKTRARKHLRALRCLPVDYPVHLVIVAASRGWIPDGNLMDGMPKDYRRVGQTSRVGLEITALDEGHRIGNRGRCRLDVIGAILSPTNSSTAITINRTVVVAVSALTTGSRGRLAAVHEQRVVRVLRSVPERRHSHPRRVLRVPIRHVKACLVVVIDLRKFLEPKLCLSTLGAGLPRLFSAEKMDEVPVWSVAAREFHPPPAPGLVDLFFRLEYAIKNLSGLTVLPWHPVLQSWTDYDRDVLRGVLGVVIH